MSKNNSQMPLELLAALRIIQLKARQPSHTQLKREAVEHLLESSNLPAQIAEVFANYRLVSQRELNYSRERGLTAEQFEAETQQIEDLMREQLTARLMREASKLFSELRYKVVKGKPLNITNRRKFDEDSLNFDKERALVAKDDEPKNTRKQLKTQSEQVQFVDEVGALHQLVLKFEQLAKEFEYESEFMAGVKKTNSFKSLKSRCNHTSDELLNDVLKSVFRRQNNRSPNLEPLYLAITLAKHILELKNTVNALRKSYYEIKNRLEKTQ